jgi:hypothetical protein
MGSRQSKDCLLCFVPVQRTSLSCTSAIHLTNAMSSSIKVTRAGHSPKLTPDSGPIGTINYLLKPSSDRLPLITGNADTFSEILGLMTEYEGMDCSSICSPPGHSSHFVRRRLGATGKSRSEPGSQIDWPSSSQRHRQVL